MTDPVDDHLAGNAAFKKIEDKDTQNIVKSGVKLVEEGIFSGRNSQL